jgi:hypothetical protein
MQGRPRLVVVEREPAHGLYGQPEPSRHVVKLVLRRCDQVRPNELPRRDRLHVEIGDRRSTIRDVRVEHADARASAARRRPDAALKDGQLDQDT